MKRTALLAIPFLLLVMLVIAVAAEVPREEALPADVQARLEQYLAYTFPPGMMEVLAAQRAERPWNFGRQMSDIVFGDSVHFQTDTGPTRTQRANLADLYYPPKEVWCALLSTADEEQASQTVVFVGLHMDMYNADLVVHEAPDDLSSQALAELLSTIGCSFALSKHN
jgi:hypothetical protein